MSSNANRKQGWLKAGVVFAVAALVIYFLARASRDDVETTQPSVSSIPDAPFEESVVVTESAPVDTNLEDASAPDSSSFDRDLDIAIRWSRVDLDTVRAAMPDNLFWELSVPTTDAAVLRERAEERARWNEEFGKVLSGTATDEEIQAYYAQRYRLSADYIEFGSHLLEGYGDVLPARDVGLLELSVKMHHARLQEMPRRLAEAVERKERQDQLREEWLEDEALFEQVQADRAQRAQN